MSVYRLSDLLDLTSLQKMADSHYRAAGMPIGIIDAIDGSILVGSGWQDICVKFHRINPVSLQRCQDSDSYIKDRLVKGEACHNKCMNGLWDIGMPIVVAGRHLATMFLGQFFYQGEAPDREFFIQLAREFGFDVDDYLAALDRVPVFSREKVENILEYNKALVSFIADLAENALLKIKADEEIRESERKFHAIFDQTYQFLGLLSSDGRLLEANKTALRFFRIEEADVIGRLFWETPWWAHSPVLQEKVRLAIQKAAKGEFIRFETTHTAADGNLHYVDFSLKPVTDETGKVVLLIPEGHDITERKRVEDEIRREKALLRCIIDSIGDLIFIKDMDGVYQACNKAGEEFIGLPESEQMGKTDLDFFGREVAEVIRERDRQILASGKEGRFEEWVNYRDGKMGLFETVKAPFYGPEGIQQGVVGISRDITERKRVEEQFRKLWRAVEQSPATIVITDTAGKIEYVNQKFTELTGYAPQEAVGNNPRILKSEHTPREEYAKLWSTISAGGEWRGEFQNKKKNGDLYWESATISPILNELGEITHFLAVKEDITERKQVQAQLEQSLSLLRATLESTADGILVVDSNGRFTSYNRKFQEMWGIPDSLLQSGADDQTLAYVRDKLIDPETFISGVQALYEQPDAESFDIIKFIDGRTFERYSQPQRLGDRIVGRVWSFRDITERKRMEEALRESEERYRALIELSPDAIFIRTDGRLIFANCEGAKLLGMEQPEDIYGRKALDFVHADSRDLVMQRMTEALQTGKPNPPEEIMFVRVDGSQIPVEVASVPFRYKGDISLMTIARDITDRKRMQAELLKTQKLESLGVLAGGIAHDFNNILTGIIGNVSLARMQVGEGHKAVARLAASENALARATDLTRQLLTFARGGEPIKKIIEVGGLLKEAASFAIHGSTVKCKFVLADDLWLVEADEGQLSQVIQNLVINARQAMPEGGTLTLEAVNVGSTQEGKRIVQISVADSGTGIPEHHLQRIFDPYFTTKQLGSGLGLATCYSIIKRHGGNITVTSTLGKGSTFYVDLPASEQGRIVETGIKMEIVHGSGPVLVMDDEEPVREATQAMLEELGYTVECTENGSDAVDLYLKRKKEGIPFSAVIMDLTIPGGMGGKEAINMLLMLDPNVKAIVSSGYSTDPVMANYREYGFVAVLRKPYRAQDLSAILHDCLSSDHL